MGRFRSRCCLYSTMSTRKTLHTHAQFLLRVGGMVACLWLSSLSSIIMIPTYSCIWLLPNFSLFYVHFPSGSGMVSVSNRLYSSSFRFRDMDFGKGIPFTSLELRSIPLFVDTGKVWKHIFCFHFLFQFLGVSVLCDEAGIQVKLHILSVIMPLLGRKSEVAYNSVYRNNF